MNKELTDWFEKCYSVYPKTRRKKGVSEQSFARHVQDKETAEKLFEWIMARNRYARSTGLEDRFRRLFSTAINQKCWLDEIPAISDVTGRAEPRNVSQCACGAYTKEKMCEKCYLAQATEEEWFVYICYDEKPWSHVRTVKWRYMDLVKKNLKQMGMWKLKSETAHEWHMRNMKYVLKSKYWRASRGG